MLPWAHGVGGSVLHRLSDTRKGEGTLSERVISWLGKGQEGGGPPRRQQRSVTRAPGSSRYLRSRTPEQAPRPQQRTHLSSRKPTHSLCPICAPHALPTSRASLPQGADRTAQPIPQRLTSHPRKPMQCEPGASLTRLSSRLHCLFSTSARFSHKDEAAPAGSRSHISSDRTPRASQAHGRAAEGTEHLRGTCPPWGLSWPRSSQPLEFQHAQSRGMAKSGESGGCCMGAGGCCGPLTWGGVGNARPQWTKQLQ